MVRGDDLSFLRGLSGLRGLVLNAGEVRDLSPLLGLPLETLTLNTPSKPRLDLDFTAFPALRTLRMYWNPGFESVFASSVESLFIFGPPDPDLTRFASLALRRLELSQGRKLVSTAGAPRSLEFLGLYQQRALSELVDLPRLRVLAIESCK